MTCDPDEFKVRARDLSVRMTQWQSVNGTEGEAKFAGALVEELSRIDYFQQHPDHLFQVKSHGEPMRSSVVAFVQGRGRKTLVLAGHFDTVGIANYGALAQTACDPETLASALIAELTAMAIRSPGEDKILADLQSGDFLPGRGLLDMKSGLAAGIVALERFASASDRPGNLMFVATPDEENRSRGMISFRNALPEIAQRFDLDIVGGINLDATSDDRDGENGRAIYLGSVGKFSPFAFVVGRPTHAGYPFAGTSAHLIGAEILRSVECNSALCDEAQGETCPAPVCLEARDMRDGYQVTTPANVWLSFNWLSHKKSGLEMLDGFRHIVENALSAALETLDRRRAAARTDGIRPEPISTVGRVLTTSELRDLVQARGGEAALMRIAELDRQLAGENDQLSVTRQLVMAMVTEAGIDGPVVIIGFSSLHYPIVHTARLEADGRSFERRIATATGVIERRHRTKIATKQFFAGISDMSFFGHQPDRRDADLIAQNTPSAALADRPPANLLSFPVVNIGPWGRDYHQKWERVHAAYSFGMLPDLVFQALLAGLAPEN